jgi:hypothetical protein
MFISLNYLILVLSLGVVDLWTTRLLGNGYVDNFDNMISNKNKIVKV